MFCLSNEIELRHLINNKFKLYLYDEHVFFKVILSQDFDWLLQENALKFINLDEENQMIQESNKWKKERDDKLLNCDETVTRVKSGWRKCDIREKHLLFENNFN